MIYNQINVPTLLSIFYIHCKNCHMFTENCLLNYIKVFVYTFTYCPQKLIFCYLFQYIRIKYCWERMRRKEVMKATTERCHLSFAVIWYSRVGHRGYPHWGKSRIIPRKIFKSRVECSLFPFRSLRNKRSNRECYFRRSLWRWQRWRRHKWWRRLWRGGRVRHFWYRSCSNATRKSG